MAIKPFYTHCIFFIVGLSLVSLGININIVSGFGVGGWDAAQIGFTKNFGFTMGFWVNVLALLYLIISAFIEKKRIKIECFLTSIVLGIGIDLWRLLLTNIQIDHSHFLLQLLIFLLGTTIISIGAGLYFVSEFPLNPLDHLLMVITRHYHCSIAVSKYILEAIGVLLAFILSGPIGYGTILMLIIFGPMIQYFTNKSTILLHKLTRMDN